MQLLCTPLAIADVLLIHPRVFGDARGFFIESYKKSEFSELGLPDFVQDNHSRSTQGVLRGLHFQKDPHQQGKLVRCVQGEIWDVAVDIRPQSATYGQWVAETLNETNYAMLYVPPGFAHGFVVLSETAEVLYKTTAEYAPKSDAGIIWNDPELAIEWPVNTPLISDKDAMLPTLNTYKNSLVQVHVAQLV
jgi:dTDP-4-dehydrorhamnose 3,5-epimerase